MPVVACSPSLHPMDLGIPGGQLDSFTLLSSFILLFLLPLPTPHKGGIPTELPPWKKGCHQTEALEYTIWRPHFIPWHRWCHQVSVIFRPALPSASKICIWPKGAPLHLPNLCPPRFHVSQPPDELQKKYFMKNSSAFNFLLNGATV